MKAVLGLIATLIALPICASAWSGQVTPTGNIGSLHWVELDAYGSSQDGTCEISQFDSNHLKSPLRGSSTIDQFGNCTINIDIGKKPLFGELAMCSIAGFSGPTTPGKPFLAHESVSSDGGKSKNLFFEWSGVSAPTEF
jgi:hypothetical protein